jgi:hypothetical protein
MYILGMLIAAFTIGVRLGALRGALPASAIFAGLITSLFLVYCAVNIVYLYWRKGRK